MNPQIPPPAFCLLPSIALFTFLKQHKDHMTNSSAVNAADFHFSFVRLECNQFLVHVLHVDLRRGSHASAHIHTHEPGSISDVN